MIKVLRSLSIMCLTIFVYEYLTDKDYIEAFSNCYWLVIGGVFVWYDLKKGINKGVCNE